jgi:hypothetical protein
MANKSLTPVLSASAQIWYLKGRERLAKPEMVG